MGGMRQCVKDVLHIAHELEDFDQAKKRIERFFVEFKAQHRGQLGVAQRVRDQLGEAYSDEPADAQVCLNRILDWLDREHLTGRRRAG